jgi:hypothetical protein
MPTRSAADVPLRRLAVIAAVLFVVILALLVGRVHAGADPAQPASSVSTAQPQDPYGSQAVPGGPPQRVPGDGGSGGGDQGGGSSEPGVSPPTQAS